MEKNVVHYKMAQNRFRDSREFLEFLENYSIKKMTWLIGGNCKGSKIFHCTFEEKSSYGTTNINEIFTWVDVSYKINNDMRSQIGGAISMGLEVTHFRSVKNKLSTKIITESDLVGESNYVPYNIWCIMFIHHQVYPNKTKQVFQIQSKCNEYGDKRNKLLYKKLLEHRHQIFLHIGSSGQRRVQHHILSDTPHVSSLIHKTTEWSPIL